eukprot:TRINITY_DN14294_c0_g1_i1.p4 TRINITY_DN14294_c0_g1~~TRINITY_DN14294_c0_g1_i1.p4  ORF type:complete len:162 (+),score=33.11 TRINITY_DN14294_c0_g1_i1:1304-1789(+)
MILDSEFQSEYNENYEKENFELSQEIAYYLEKMLLDNDNLAQREENLLFYFENHFLNYQLDNIPEQIHKELQKNYLDSIIQIFLNYSLNNNAILMCTSFIQQMLEEVKINQLVENRENNSKTYLSLKMLLECLYREKNDNNICLLYTSDAADEEDSVDLGV